MRPLRSLTHKSAHGHTWGLLPACSPKGEEHIRKLLCRNRLRGLSWKGTSQSRLFATASKQPACPQSGHEPSIVSDRARNAPLLHLNYRDTRTVMIQNAHGITSNDSKQDRNKIGPPSVLLSSRLPPGLPGKDEVLRRQVTVAPASLLVLRCASWEVPTCGLPLKHALCP